MLQQNLNPTARARLDSFIADLENKVALGPGKNSPVDTLLTVLESYVPDAKGIGTYSNCQRHLARHVTEEDMRLFDLPADVLANRLTDWQIVLNKHHIDPHVAVPQAFRGDCKFISPKGTTCGLRMSLFDAEGVVPEFCLSCYKVQILASNVIALIRLHFIMRHLKLPKDNYRKCMIELRENVPNPYKGYIYCTSEEEAGTCLDILQSALTTAGITGIECRLSHGCSEYSLKYPEFKYAADGSHRSFARPEPWNGKEVQFFSAHKDSGSVRTDYNNQALSVRDLLCFRTWLEYADIIGDDSCQIFDASLRASGDQIFTARVRDQAEQRKAELLALNDKSARTGVKS
ncbi:MAG: hypothetical protein GY948_04945 [Alphaproteobacteria bacterium]|nr:hypothetical protein [Alphaproteobacteria bacterium]